MADQRFSDEDLRRAVAEGGTRTEIAKRFGVTYQAVNSRLKRLELLAQAAISLRPETAERYVRHRIDAMEQLTRGLGRVNLLMDACDEWLRDPDRPEKYTVGPRASDVEVIYFVPGEPNAKGEPTKERKRAKLQALLDDVGGTREVERGEWKHADPRELILKTVAEARQAVQLGADIARLLADARSMQVLREAVIEEIRGCDPDMARRVAAAVHRTIQVNTELGGPDVRGAAGVAATART